MGFTPTNCGVYRAARRMFAVLCAFIALHGRASLAADFNVPEARKSVVLVRCLTPGFPEIQGSGFIVSPKGLIYTCRHVVKPDDTASGGTILVGVPSKKDPEELDYFPAQIVFSTKADEPLDFAVLEIAARDGYGPFKPLPLAKGSAELGSSVAALGFPRVDDDHPELSLTKGNVSSSRRKLDGVSYCQTDAAVNPGNSGGPLLNAAGEAIGIVTAKKLDAENIGFATYLSEVKSLGDAAAERAALPAVSPQPGPVDPAKLPKPNGIKPAAESWNVGAGKVEPIKGVLLPQNSGGEYWVSSKKELPEDFQLNIECAVGFLQGRQHIQPSQRFILRTLAVRFGSDDTTSDILSRKGYMLQFSHAGIWLYKENGQEGGECVAKEWIGNPEGPMILTITKSGSDITVTANHRKLLQYHDPQVIGGKHKFCIGGYLSQLILGPVTISEPGSNAPSAGAPAGKGPVSKGAAK